MWRKRSIIINHQKHPKDQKHAKQCGTETSRACIKFSGHTLSACKKRPMFKSLSYSVFFTENASDILLWLHTISFWKFNIYKPAIFSNQLCFPKETRRFFGEKEAIENSIEFYGTLTNFSINCYQLKSVVKTFNIQPRSIILVYQSIHITIL